MKKQLTNGGCACIHTDPEGLSGEISQGGSGWAFSDTGAVSTVVSAILLLGLVVSCIAFIEVHYVPSWGADEEARHMRDVFVDFSSIPGRIDALVLYNETDIVSKQRIELGGGEIPFIVPGKSWGTIGVVPDDGNFTVTADVRMVNITGNSSSGNITNEGVNITNISSVSRFYIYINHTGYRRGCCGKVWDGEIFVNVTPRGGVKLEMVPKQEGGGGCGKHGKYLKISTWNSDGDKIVDGIYIDSDVSKKYSSYYTVDLLNPSYGFNKVLSDADTPYNLTITSSMTACSYEIIYNECNKSLVRYSATSNGTLIYESMNRYFIDQRFIYQNGAVFLCQPPNMSMRIAPDISIEEVGGCAHLLIPMVTVDTGEHRIPMISGSGVEELQLKLDHTNQIRFAEGNNTNKVHIIIEPPEGNENFRENYLQEWANYFNEIVGGTSVEANPAWSPDDSYANINITLNGSIHLNIRDTGIEGRISSIS